MDGVSLAKYRIVRKGQFSFNPNTARMGDKIPIALNEGKDCLVSQIYPVFKIIDEKTLLPEFLFLFFNRPEFDRYARYHSWGSARETFDWDDMCNVKIPIPDIKIQESIVTIYNTLNTRNRLNQILKDKLKPLSPVLIRGVIEKHPKITEGMSQRFTEAKLEQVFIDLLKKEGYPIILEIYESEIGYYWRLDFLSIKYSLEKITDNEIEKIIHQIKNLSSSNIYDSNKKVMDWLTNGFILNREDENKKDILIHLVDSTDIDNNNFKFINQLSVGSHRRIPNGIVYKWDTLGVIEFKSAIREEATIHNAYTQLTGYKRDIPQLFI